MLAGLLDCFVITPAASGSGVAKQGSVALQSELLARTPQTVRLHVAAWVGLGRPIPTKRRSRVVAGIQWMRIPKKIHAPTTGVAKRTSSPNTVATNARLRRTNTHGELSELS